MTVIVDSQSVIWATDDPGQLTPTATAALRTARKRFVSAATIWEIAIKVALGKLRLS